MVYYEHFCPQHIGMLVVIFTIWTVSLLLVRKASEKTSAILVRCLSVLLFFCEMTQDLLLVHEGVDMMTILPLHLCNLGIFVDLLASFTKGKVSAFFAEVSLVLIMPGALGAILFPDWNYRPFWNWLSLMCFFTHTLLVLLPFIFLITKRSRVKITHIWYPLAFIAVVTPPIAWVDFTYRHNYMFLRYPVDGSPLEWVYNLSDGKYYIPGLICLLIGVLTVEYLIIEGIKFIGRRVQKSES